MSPDAAMGKFTGKSLPGDSISAALRAGEFVPAETMISKHYKSAGDGAIELLDTEKRLKIVYVVDEQYGWRLFYNGGHRDFICLEPQTCMVNCQNSELDRAETGFDFITPHACKKYVSQLRVEKQR